MSAILGFFLVILVIIFAIGFSIISGVLRLLFGFGRKQSYYSGRHSKPSQNSSQNNRTQQRSSENDNMNTHKKIFGDDEGEYVDFEEIKEDDKK